MEEDVGKCKYKVVVLLLKNPFKEGELNVGFYLIRVSEELFPIKAIISDRGQERKLLLGIIEWARAHFTNAIIACKRCIDICETWNKLKSTTGLYIMPITPSEFRSNIVDTCFVKDALELDSVGLSELPVAVPPMTLFDSALPWEGIIEHLVVHMGENAKAFRTSDATHFVLFSDTDEDLLLHVELTGPRNKVNAYLRRKNDSPVPVPAQKTSTEAERDLITRFTREVVSYVLGLMSPLGL